MIPETSISILPLHKLINVTSESQSKVFQNFVKHLIQLFPLRLFLPYLFHLAPLLQFLFFPLLQKHTTPAPLILMSKKLFFLFQGRKEQIFRLDSFSLLRSRKTLKQLFAICSSFPFSKMFFVHSLVRCFVFSDKPKFAIILPAPFAKH